MFGVTLYNVKLNAPTRAFLNQAKQHSGYFTCKGHTQIGANLNPRLVFLANNGKYKTD